MIMGIEHDCCADVLANSPHVEVGSVCVGVCVCVHLRIRECACVYNHYLPHTCTACTHSPLSMFPLCSNTLKRCCKLKKWLLIPIAGLSKWPQVSLPFLSQARPCQGEIHRAATQQVGKSQPKRKKEGWEKKRNLRDLKSHL